ncbi:hypothetical protein MUA31_01330 [Staphylococcus simulans]|uniref:hypothetical protein n=2 Tax=Staphylococcus TaxID=1279 RepID=UPI0021D17555|nr:hypothetical protein [Staphylococcus simulans]UXR35598.1 hypothetical protein MUA31_01330 [Staphylococcus simulans]
MSLPTHLRIEGSLSEIIEVLMKYEDASTLSHDNLFKTKNVEAMLYQLFVKHMSQKERQIIERSIKTSEYMTFIEEKDAQHMQLLAQTHYLLPIQKSLNYIDNEFLNNYNYYILNGSPTKFPELAQTAKDQNSIKYWVESGRRAKDNMTLSEFLDVNFTVNQLKEICRTHKIKGFSKGPKKHIIHLVEQAFFESPDNFIVGYSKEAYQLLAYFILENRNSIPKSIAEDLNTDFWLIDTDRLNTIYFIPANTMKQIKDFFNTHKMNPLDYVRPEDQVLYQDSTKGTVKETTEVDTSHYTATDEDEAINLEAKLERLLAQEEQLSPECEFFAVLLNLYGVVPYQFATTLFNRFFNEAKSETEIKTMAADHLKDILVSDNDYYIHPLIEEEYPNILAHFEDISYFVPTSYEALLTAGELDTLNTNKNIRNTLKFFLKLFKDDDMKEFLMDIIVLQPLKRHTDITQLDQIIEELALEPEVRRFNNLEVKRHLKKLAYYLPLWKLRGHSQAELDATAR